MVLCTIARVYYLPGFLSLSHRVCQQEDVVLVDLLYARAVVGDCFLNASVHSRKDFLQSEASTKGDERK